MKTYIIMDFETCRVFMLKAEDLDAVKKKYHKVLCDEDSECDLEPDDVLDQCLTGDIIVKCLDDYAGQDVVQLIDY